MNRTLYAGRMVKALGIERSFGVGDKAVYVLRGIDLTVDAGTMIALYGPSGSGKTTLLNVIGALDVPDRGEVWIGDENILQMSERSRARIRRKCIGFIFQNETLMSTYSARENIDLVLRLQGLNFFERRKRATTALEAMGLSAWADHLPEELSGGQRQRVAIARALALRPALILADEPTSGLDTRMARRVLSLFVGIAKTQGTAFLIVSHDSVVTEFVNEAYDLREGLLVRRVDHNGSVLEKIVSSA